jgi:hypothetical protein
VNVIIVLPESGSDSEASPIDSVGPSSLVSVALAWLSAMLTVALERATKKV